MSEFETLRFEVHEGVGRITLDRPDKRNAMNRQMFQELAEAAEAAEADPDVRGVIVSGEGSSFCAGIDLNLIGELAGVADAEFRSFVRLAQRPFLLLAGMGKPTVAAVHGHALGAGCQLALACDLRVAASDARFGILEARYGLVPDLGGMLHLSRLIGPARTKELVWSARTVESEEAERIGLVNRLCRPEALDTEAETLLAAATAHSPVVISLTKSLIDGAAGTPLQAELEREAEAQARAVGSDDHREAVAAFMERRDPRYKGS